MSTPILPNAGGFNIVDLQDRITAYVKSIVPNTLVLEDSIPDDFSPPVDEERKVIPYVVLRYGPMRPSYTGRSLMGPRYDEYWASCDVIAITPAGRMSRQLLAGLVDALIGFKPDGISPMAQRLDAGDPAQFVVSSNESRPTQYVATTRLRYTLNGTNIGAPVTIP